MLMQCPSLFYGTKTAYSPNPVSRLEKRSLFPLEKDAMAPGCNKTNIEMFSVRFNANFPSVHLLFRYHINGGRFSGHHWVDEIQAALPNKIV